MKRISIPFLLFLLLQLSAVGQKIEVKHGQAYLGGGENPVSIIEIENSEIKTVEKKWSAYLKDYNGKVSKQGDVWFHDNAQIKAISKDTLDMWSTVKASGSSVIITLAVQSGDAFISNASGHHKGVDRFLREFATDTHKHFIGLELSLAKKNLKNKEKEYEKLEKTNRDLEKEIDKMKNKISEHEQTIKKNKEILEQHKNVMDEHDSNVKELEKKIKNLD